MHRHEIGRAITAFASGDLIDKDGSASLPASRA